MSEEAPPVPPSAQPAPPPPPLGSVSKPSDSSRKALIFGCGGCALLLVFVAILGAGIASFVFKILGDSEAAKAALREAKSSPVLVEEIGEPMKMGWMISGSVNVTNDKGDADVQIPVEGPKGEASVHVVGTRKGGEWEFTKIEATVAGSGTVVDLLAD